MSLVAIPLTHRVKTATGTQTEEKTGYHTSITIVDSSQHSTKQSMLHVFSSDPSHPQSKDSYGNTDRGKTGYDTGITIVDSPQHSTKQSMLHVFTPRVKTATRMQTEGKHVMIQVNNCRLTSTFH